MKKIVFLFVFVWIIAITGYFALSFILYKSTFQYQYQDNISYDGLNNDKFTLSTGEDIEIVFSKKDDNEVFVYFHGNTGRVPFIIDFLKENYSFISPSYAGYGASSGKPSVKNIYEMVEKTKDFVQSHFPDKKIYVMGHSLGSQPAFYYGTIDEKTKVLAIVEGFDSVYQMCKERMGVFNFICFIAKGSFSAENLAKNHNLSHTNFISFHSPEDVVVSFNRGISLYNQVRAKKKMFFNFQQGKHGSFNVKLATDVIVMNDK